MYSFKEHPGTLLRENELFLIYLFQIQIGSEKIMKLASEEEIKNVNT